MKLYLLILTTLLASLNAGCSNEKGSLNNKGISLSKAMGDAGGENFMKAETARRFTFPDDHGPHPDFRTEWWYFTGNLTSADGREFGYQFTIFRTSLTKDKPLRASDWNSNQIYMAHFAVTDISGGRFFFDERFSREGNRLAGASAKPFRVWLEDWEITETGGEGAFGLPQIRIKAANENCGIDFTLNAAKNYVLQGDSGLSRKGAAVGNASYYYSYTDLATEGNISVSGKSFAVSGSSWMDREWSTSALSNDQAGWDWFALQLDGGTELMFYQMRKTDGTSDEYSKGIVVFSDGTSNVISRNDVTLEVTDFWKNSSGVSYPSGWMLRIPSLDAALKITPAVKDQMLDVSVKYWEGAVRVEGLLRGGETKGKGYVELTGY